MSKIDRDQPTALRLAGILAAVVVIIGIFIFSGLNEEAQYNSIARDSAAQYSEHANKEIGYACVGAASPDKQKCYDKARNEAELKKRDNKRNEADLVAQRKSALWTGIMGIAALIGMGLSAIGVWLVWTTFRETKKSADTALEALHANRAWLTFEGFHHARICGHIDDGGIIPVHNGIMAHISWINTGGSPARKCAAKLSYRLLPMAGPAPTFEEEECQIGGGVIGVSQRLSSNKVALNDEETVAFRNRELALYLFNQVWYADVYSDAIRSSQICVRLIYEGTTGPHGEQDSILAAPVGPQNKAH